MFSKLKKIILNHSDSYNFYKNKYEELLVINSTLEDHISTLTSENQELKNNFEIIISNQNELNQNVKCLKLSDEKNSDMFSKINSYQQKYSSVLDHIAENNSLLLSNQKELNNLTKDLKNNKECEKMFSDIISSQKEFKQNQKHLEEISLNIERNTSYSHIKLDSKFNEQQRFIKNTLNNFTKDTHIEEK